uniref:Myozenin 1b n=1 Tax=Astyanax mexicanus TaxID=7994 RepID=A0A8B9LQC1_ASTMX
MPYVCKMNNSQMRRTAVERCSLFSLCPLSFSEEAEPEATEFDLGTKIKTPKEVMLEELSLMKGKGSKMFKMRQARVEKFIVSTENLQNLQNLVPSKGGEMKTPPTPAPKPELPKEEVDPEAEKLKRRSEYVKTYISPWERAMKDDEELKATMRPQMPGPYVYQDLPKYKSFNRYVQVIFAKCWDKSCDFVHFFQQFHHIQVHLKKIVYYGKALFQ